MRHPGIREPRSRGDLSGLSWEREAVRDIECSAWKLREQRVRERAVANSTHSAMESSHCKRTGAPSPATCGKPNLEGP